MNSVFTRTTHLNGVFAVLLLLVAVDDAWSEACRSDHIDLRTQAEIDAFQAVYGPCDRITGNLILTAFEIESLAGLMGLSAIEGDLLIENARELRDLRGLDALEMVGGDVTIFHN
ncbi:MAG: hypothetical protein R3212_00825, partial [Xanthomonadales bacterium]|nr:hypothetical protein [Xanthomonadales bacterium]